MAVTTLMGSCGDEEQSPCASQGQLVPGQGVGAGGTSICVGQGGTALDTALGAPSVTLDMGQVGQRVVYEKLNLALLYSGKGTGRAVRAIYLGPASTLKTAGGVGIGSTEAQVKAALGAPAKDPFIGALWYPQLGITLQLEAGKVATIMVTSPDRAP